MNSRLRQIIKLKTGGNQADFAALMGWSNQYTSRLVRGDSGIGLRPVVAILEKFPDINARWLLLGEGAMVSSGVDKAKEHLFRLLALEKYMPVMTAEEIRQLTEEGLTDFPPSTISRWQQLLSEREEFFNNAMNRSSICKTPKAN